MARASLPTQRQSPRVKITKITPVRGGGYQCEVESEISPFTRDMTVDVEGPLADVPDQVANKIKVAANELRNWIDQNGLHNE